MLQKRDALLDDCTRAALVIAPFPVPGGCAAATIIDRRRLDETGAITLKVQDDRSKYARRALLARTVPGRVRHAHSGARLRIRRKAAILVRRTYALPIGLIDFALYELILHFADELKKYFTKGTRRAAALH